MHVILNIACDSQHLTLCCLDSIAGARVIQGGIPPLDSEASFKAVPHQLHARAAQLHGVAGWVGAAKVEVLLRHQAFKPKVNASGTQVKSKNISWSAGVMEAWEKCMEFLRQDEVE